MSSSLEGQGMATRLQRGRALHKDSKDAPLGSSGSYLPLVQATQPMPEKAECLETPLLLKGEAGNSPGSLRLGMWYLPWPQRCPM